MDPIGITKDLPLLYKMKSEDKKPILRFYLDFLSKKSYEKVNKIRKFLQDQIYAQKLLKTSPASLMLLRHWTYILKIVDYALSKKNIGQL